MTRSRGAVAALVAVLTGVLVCGVLAGWRENADLLLFVVGMVGYVWIIVTDSSLRGRSGAGWLLACILIAPIGLLAFLFVAVRDRTHGRRGIETFWAPGVRWCYLAAVGLAALALGLALVQVSVAKPDLGPNSTISGKVDGSCENSAIGLVLGKEPGITEMFGVPAPSAPSGQSLPSASGGPPTAQQAALDQFAQRCTAAAGRRMVASEASLTGGLTLALIGGLNHRRRRPVPPAPAPVTLAA